MNTHHVSSGDEDLVRLYLADIGRYQLLTRDDEVFLAIQMERGDAARQLLHEPGMFCPDEQGRLERAVQAGDDARRTFVQANLRLVVSIARAYQSSGVDLLDLIQEGNFGLMRAVEKFDWRKGFKFSTYATWWIRQSIARGITISSRTIRLPMNVDGLLKRLQRTQFTLSVELGRPPTTAELARELDVPIEKVTELLILAREPASLSDAFNGEGSTASDLLADPSAESPSDAATRGALPVAVAKILDQLDVRERAVISMRFGLNGEPPRTLAQIGVQLGLSAERIRQIEHRAMARLRTTPFDEDVRELLNA